MSIPWWVMMALTRSPMDTTPTTRGRVKSYV